MSKALFALPFVALALIAARPAEAPPAQKTSLNPPAEIAADPANRLNIQLSNGGTVVIQLRPDAAPNHVRRIQALVTQGFYNGTVFHRVISGFMAQGGDPTATGQGGSPLPDLPAEFNALPHLRGVMSMARAEDPNSANSQFFIILAPTFALDHKYTGFGRVIAGMQYVDAIAPGEPPAQPTRIVRAWLDGPPPAEALAAAPAPVSAPSPAEMEAAAKAVEAAADAVSAAEQSQRPDPVGPAAQPAPASEQPAPTDSAQAPETPPQETPAPQH